MTRSKPHSRRLLPALAALALPILLTLSLVPAAQAGEGHACHEAPAASAEAAVAPAPVAAEAPAPTATDGKIPDLLLVDQEGNPVHFYRDLVAGKVVAMNFIFTSCTTVCPPMGAVFGRLQKELGEQDGPEVHLISVSIDPVTDTPERLKAWSQKFDAGPTWTLVTGPKPEVDQLLRALKVFTPDAKDHSPLVLLGNDRTGVWQRAHGLTPPAKLAELLQGLSSGAEVADNTLKAHKAQAGESGSQAMISQIQQEVSP
jgi:cytochrome oxidase Cu insertion factor (SCO1/SenC/PrrC family)